MKCEICNDAGRVDGYPCLNCEAEPSEVSSTGLLSVELPRDELARITSWGAGMQTMPDCYWDSDSKRLWSKLMKIRTDNGELRNRARKENDEK